MKIVLTLSAKKGVKGRKALAKTAVKLKRVRNSNGKMITLRMLDAGSDSFGRDLGTVFQRNVTKARATGVRLKSGSGTTRGSRKVS